MLCDLGNILLPLLSGLFYEIEMRARDRFIAFVTYESNSKSLWKTELKDKYILVQNLKCGHRFIHNEHFYELPMCVDFRYLFVCLLVFGHKN